MVVLAASITTRSGKPLLSRQFKDITRDRVTELLSNFQGLVSNSKSQHTFVEDEHVRYVYRPFEDFYIILITNRQSNIIQDLDTLNLFTQTVNSMLKGFDENDIFDNAFEILGSFDEIISLGYKENLTLSQIQNFLSMESHEEMIQEIIERGKEFDAKEQRKRAAQELMRKEQERKMYGGNLPEESLKFGAHNNASNLNNAYNSYYSQASPEAQKSYYQHNTGNDNNGIPSSNEAYGSNSLEKSVRGLKIGESINKASGGRNVGNINNNTGTFGTRSSNNNNTSDNNNNSNFINTKPTIEEPENNGILTMIKETINAQISREGDVSTSELKGVLELRINDPEYSKSKLSLNVGLVDPKDRSLQFKTHPNIDKAAFLKEGTIALKDSSKSFPTNDHSLGVLRWRKICNSDDTSLIPLQINTWVSSDDAGITEVTFEFEITVNYDQPLKDLYFVIPVYTDNVSINQDVNDSQAVIKGVDEEQGVIVYVEQIQPGEQGVFGITIDADENSLFPINVSFVNTNAVSSCSGVSVVKVQDENSNSDFPFDSISTLKTDKYLII
ncbi:related to Coatomer subunit delta [Saccharomycodes ludwigii]|uniref:Coatomer subunit delta n=1 Tax=Saccharomycodes ludwigii TaxID=36035 RepID=A0A376B9W8_9ASCO|nr:hypothetical protein SCDLUD_002255 [Saccharomycodes ludwigii]KAH3900802.1 hypothetical protein SCDLUD_002255 [Saccharomycodes ludwigii]SSD61473.1 related to Coatomer subunit delta [Saccharomycodes ludwigii]